MIQSYLSLSSTHNQIFMTKFVRESNSIKYTGHNQDDLVLTIADMDLPLYPPIKKAIISKLQITNNFTYKLPSKQYYQSIIRWYKDRHAREQNFQVKPQYIVDTPSIINILSIAIYCFTQPRDGVLIFTPVWSVYQDLALKMKRTPIECRLYNERHKNVSRYDINFTDLEEKAKKTRLMFLCNPHNPSGRIWTRKQLLKIVSICEKHNILLVSDQILSDLVPESLSHKFYSLSNSNYPRLIVANSISKSFNMQSLRGGYALVKDDKIRKYVKEVFEMMSIYVNDFSRSCTEIVYSNEGKEWLNYATGIIKKNHYYLIEKMKKTMLTISQYEGSQLILLNFEGYIKFIERWFHSQNQAKGQPRNMVSLFLKSHNIYGNLITYFGLYQNIYTEMRFNIALEENIFRKFADRLYSALLEVEYVYREIDSKL